MKYYRFEEYDEFDIIFAGERKLKENEVLDIDRIIMRSEGSPVTRFLKDRSDYIEDLTVYMNSKGFNIIETEFI